SARVLENPLHLRGRTRLVDRNHNGTGEPDGEVDKAPLEAGLAHEPDLVARLDTGGDEALGEGGDFRKEFARREVGPRVVTTGQRENGQIGRFLDPLDEQVGDVRLWVRLHKGGRC